MFTTPVKSDYLILMLNDTCSSFQGFVGIGLTKKSYDEKFIIHVAQCAFINNGATLTKRKENKRQNKSSSLNFSTYNKLPEPFFSLRIIFSRSKLQRMMSPSKLAVAR